MPRLKKRPFWLDRGTQICSHCQGHYHVQMEYRCAACDHGICEHCAMTVKKEVFCSSCHAGTRGKG